MAAIVRTTIVKSVGTGLLGVTVYSKVPQCGIAGKSLRESLPKGDPKPKPFDYKNRYYRYHNSLFDRTSHRFDQNTKVIVVDGPIAVGKTEFACNLAQDLDMKHYPEANMDIHYVREDGFDLRCLDPKLPLDARSFDHKNFSEDPTNLQSANYQIMTYIARYSQYIDAMTHLLNTGQGVVLERSPFSDHVFLEAMVSQNFVSRKVRHLYYEIKKNTISELLRPHLVIYLDIPVDVVKQRIKERCLPHEVNSKAYSDEYLKVIEHEYKHKYLREISAHSELLVYDWTCKGDPEVVVEDIERVDFDTLDPHSLKFKDWRMWNEMEWADLRMKYTNGKPFLMNLFNVPNFDIPELLLSADDSFEENCVHENTPELQYLPGYRKALGDTGLLFKNKVPKFGEHLC